MTIDLSQFLDKEVTVTLRNGEKFVTKIKKTSSEVYPFYCKRSDHSDGTVTYTKDGIVDIDLDWHTLDIVDIQLKTKPQELNMTKLSANAFHNLSEVLTPEVIDYIINDGRYVDFMQEMIPDALTHLMGELEEPLHYELSFAIMDNISMRTTK